MTAADAIAAMAALPVATLAEVTGSRPALILAPHADDETLGCGGLIAGSVAAGHPPFVLIVTDGAGSHPNSATYPASRLRELREHEARTAVGRLGLPPDMIDFLRLRDTAAPIDGPEFDAAVRAIRATASRIGAATILAPWKHDPHGDHVAVHRMAIAAARPPLRHLSYPVWGWVLAPETILPDPLPRGVRLDVGAYIAAKQHALAAHASQYGGLIDDDPSGFVLPAALLAVFARPFETFLLPG